MLPEIISILIRKYGRLVVEGVLLLAFAALASGYHSRGQKIETMKAKAEASEARYQADRKACAEISDDLAKQQHAVGVLEAKAARLSDIRDHALDEMHRIQRGYDDSMAKKETHAVVAVTAGETCEDQVRVLARELAGMEAQR